MLPNTRVGKARKSAVKQSKCRHCRKEYKTLKYGMFCPNCNRYIKPLDGPTGIEAADSSAV